MPCLEHVVFDNTCIVCYRCRVLFAEDVMISLNEKLPEDKKNNDTQYNAYLSQYPDALPF